MTYSILSFILVFLGLNFVGERVFAVSEVENLIAQAQNVLNLSKLCIPQNKNKSTIFCTGFTLSDLNLSQLAKETSACTIEIKKNGYTIVMQNLDGKIPSDQWDSFIHSTQRALTFHQQKVVAFKNDMNRIDCFHELIHVYQHTQGSGKLSPRNRSLIIEKIQHLLEKKIPEIEKLEKNKEVAQAKKMAILLEPLIESLKELNSLVDGLDELEAHLYIYQKFEVLNWDLDSLETVIANLFRRAHLLPKDLRQKIEKEARDIVRRKKRFAMEKAAKEWKPLSDSDKAILASLLREPWQKIFDEIKKKNLRILRVDEAAESGLLMENMISKELFNSLELPNSEELRFLQDSKILKGTAIGKYLCKQDSIKKAALLLTSKATVGTVVHEYFHYLQSEINPTYCDAIFGQKLVDENFKVGKVSRSEHDQKILLMQAINVLAEQEVYSFLNENQNLMDKFEKMNNEIMLKTYNSWLNE